MSDLWRVGVTASSGLPTHHMVGTLWIKGLTWEMWGGNGKVKTGCGDLRSVSELWSVGVTANSGLPTNHMVGTLWIKGLTWKMVEGMVKNGYGDLQNLLKPYSVGVTENLVLSVWPSHNC